MLGCQAQKRRGNDALPTTICWQCIHFLLDPRAGSSSHHSRKPYHGPTKKTDERRTQEVAGRFYDCLLHCWLCWKSGLSTNALCSWVLKVWPGFKAKVQPALFFWETIHLNSVNLLVIMKRPGLQPLEVLLGTYGLGSWQEASRVPATSCLGNFLEKPTLHVEVYIYVTS